MPKTLSPVSLLFFLCAVSLAAESQQTIPTSPPAGGVTATGPTFRVTRSISGSKGSAQGGRFVMEDPRTIFYLPADKQVIVYFEWEGPVGSHKFEGYWKSPDGKASVFSDFSFEAKTKQFGGFWTLTLSEGMQTGLWTLEARVDGEITGTHTFQVLAAARPADAPQPPSPLAPAELYKRAGEASVFIERMDAHGRKFGTGTGFFLSENTVVTAFQVIDGASALRVLLPDGKRLESNTVVAWNRRQDWAVLEVAARAVLHLERAEKNSWSVGDRVYLLDSPNEGSRTIADADLVGTQELPGAGRRLAISIAPTQTAIGGPLLNEYGKVIGVVGGSLVPGASSLQGMSLYYPRNSFRILKIIQSVLSVPMDLVSLISSQRTTLEELARGGQFIPPLTRQEDVMSGTLARQIDHRGPLEQPIGESAEFARGLPEIFALLGWNPKSKHKALAELRVFDIENRNLIHSLPTKMNFEPGRMFYEKWKLPIGTLKPGIYRVDLLLDGEPAWRTFFEILE